MTVATLSNEMPRTCPQCGTPNVLEALTCTECGAPLPWDDALEEGREAAATERPMGTGLPPAPGEVRVPTEPPEAEPPV